MSASRPTVRVSFLIDSLSRAGTETQLLALIRSLDRSKVTPSLAILNGNSAESKSLEPTDCPVLQLGLSSFKNLAATAKAAARLAKFWKQNRVNVVQTYFLDSTYFGVPLARALGIRRVLRVRNNIGHWLTPAHRGLGRLMGRIADATITNSQPGWDALRAAEGVHPDKIVVLENGVDFDRFGSLTPRPRSTSITIGTMANLRPVKGIDTLIRAARRVIDLCPATRFIVAGEGEQRPELEQLITKLGLQDRVKLVGRITDAPAFLANLDIAVLPSNAESMSNALLEFMAAGRPIVATDVGANGQLLGDNQRGLLVPPGDVAALAAEVIRLIEEPSLAAQLATAARKHARDHFSRDSMRLRFENFYQRLCA